jgi:thiol-disulfide isomerase/thioredoxin
MRWGSLPLVINFWASWCAPCRREQPMLEALSRVYAERGVLFVGVNSRDSNDAAARSFVRELGVTYPSVVDADGKIAFRFGISAGLPGTVVVDAGGTIRYRRQGEISRRELQPLIDDVLGPRGLPQQRAV